MSQATVQKKDVELPRPTISTFVVGEFSRDPKIATDELIKRVRSKFPWSKFQNSHVVWYKYQIRHGRYTLAGKAKLEPPRRGKKKADEKKSQKLQESKKS